MWLFPFFSFFSLSFSPSLIILSPLQVSHRLNLMLSQARSRRLIKRKSEKLTLINVNTLCEKSSN